MGFPSIEPSEVGLTGLLWLFGTYGYVLYYASGLIGEGSELLLLVPSLAGLVGGVVLPLLGAVPDGAIILFSGLGDIETAQQTLSVGVGALAGSTIMLLTVPLALSIMAGRVDLNEDGSANYFGKPKLSKGGLFTSGVVITDAVRKGGCVMMATTIPYLLIQIPAYFLHGPTKRVSEGEHWYAAAAFCICLAGLLFYMRLQLQISQQGLDRGKRMAVIKKSLQEGRISLSGAVASQVKETEKLLPPSVVSQYQSTSQNALYPPPEVASYLKEVLAEAFYSYDSNKNGQLDRRESYTFFRDFHECISEEEMNQMFTGFDVDKSGSISLDEFIGLAYTLIKAQDSKEPASDGTLRVAKKAMAETAFAEVEEEEVPEELTDLPPDEQQAAIKKKAFWMLLTGTVLVVLFSDPMVDVMQEIATRAHMSPFYVSFILAPLASNASEVLSSQYYAAKKTTKTITVSLSALEGAASMNNTFCLSIFMGLVFFRPIAWQYTAETVAIVLVQIIVGLLMQSQVMTFGRALLIGSIFPLSILLVAFLESPLVGLD